MKSLQQISDSISDLRTQYTLMNPLLGILDALDNLVDNLIANQSGTPQDLDDVLTPKDVATMLRIHLKTVYKLVEAGKLPGKRLGHGWRFSRKQLIEVVKGGKIIID